MEQAEEVGEVRLHETQATHVIQLGIAEAQRTQMVDFFVDLVDVARQVDAGGTALEPVLHLGAGMLVQHRLHAEDLDLCRRARDAGAVVAIANDLQVTHVRGVSSRSRPFFVEWHKHRGLWRYFRKFEAPRRNLLVQGAVWTAIWAHAAAQVPRLLRARRPA